jgi:hypothetical protein
MVRDKSDDHCWHCCSRSSAHRFSPSFSSTSFLDLWLDKSKEKRPHREVLLLLRRLIFLSLNIEPFAVAIDDEKIEFNQSRIVGVI